MKTTIKLLALAALASFIALKVFGAPTTGTVEMRQYNGTGWVPLQLAPLAVAGLLQQTASGVPSFNSSPSTASLNIVGTANAGFIKFQTQSVNPSAPGAGFMSLYCDSALQLAWKLATSAFQTEFSSTPTADRIHTLVDRTSTIAEYADNLSVFSATTSSQLRGIISDESGTGVALFGTSPTITTSIALAGGGSITEASGAIGINAGGSNKSVTVTASGSGTVVLASVIQATTFSNPTSGKSVEIGHDGTEGILQAFNRGTAATPMWVGGSSVVINTGSGAATPALTIDSSQNSVFAARVTTGTTIKLRSYIVSGLPSASTEGAGALAYVTDSTATAITGLGLAVVGGGSNKVEVISDGTNWIVQ